MKKKIILIAAALAVLLLVAGGVTALVGVFSEIKDVEQDIRVEQNKVDEESFTITFNTNGGELSQNSLSVRVGKEYVLPTPTKAGYRFAGWYNGNVLYTSGTWEEYEDVTLVAQWAIYGADNSPEALENIMTYTAGTYNAQDAEDVNDPLAEYSHKNVITVLDEGMITLLNTESGWASWSIGRVKISDVNFLHFYYRAFDPETGTYEETAHLIDGTNFVVYIDTGVNGAYWYCGEGGDYSLPGASLNYINTGVKIGIAEGFKPDFTDFKIYCVGA